MSSIIHKEAILSEIAGAKELLNLIPDFDTIGKITYTSLIKELEKELKEYSIQENTLNFIIGNTMKLYEKGLYTYNKALNYANTDLKNYLSKPIASNNEKLHCEYELSLVINRLYYGLYQMAKSYLVSKHSAKLEHRWTSVNKRLLDNKINSIQVIQNINIANNITIFIQSMDDLRSKRNRWDYKLSHSKNYQHEYSEMYIVAKNAYTSFQKLQPKLGEPQC